MKIKVRIDAETPDLIHPSRMKDGSIGIIVHGPSDIRGALLARHCGKLTVIGSETYGVDGWGSATDPAKDLMVRVLKKGERVTLEVA